MNILAVDDKALPLRALEAAIRQAEPNASIYACESGMKALETAETTAIDVAFIDIQMPGINGIDLAQRLKLMYPKLNIIFATGYDDYMDSAFAMHASGYLMKPITADAVKNELINLRHPLYPSEPMRITVQCFGNFEVFADRKPLQFRYEKTKEVLAYLIDRRSMCSNGEIIATLWQNDISDSYFRTLRKDLSDTFKNAGEPDYILLQRGRLGVDHTKMSCDYYEWLSGLPSALNAYHGEYMAQYSWAEFSHAVFRKKDPE